MVCFSFREMLVVCFTCVLVLFGKAFVVLVTVVCLCLLTALRVA